MNDQERIVEKIDVNRNADPISGEAGSHPVGTGIGASSRIAGTMQGNSTNDQERIVEKIDVNRNADPISGEAGSHPVGTGIGATSSGIAGAIVGGVLGGPIGAVVGAAIYGVIGGMIGKEVAEGINPTVENEYWMEHYSSRSYVDPAFGYDQYGPAYQQGWEAGLRYNGKTYDEIEPDLQSNWETDKTAPKLSWEQARPASRDAWDRLQEHRNKYVK